jgi:hypothetical protein
MSGMDGRSPVLRPLTRKQLDTGGFESQPPGANPNNPPSVRLVPLTRFQGDVTITGGATGIDAVFTTAGGTYPLLWNLRGFRLINVSGNVWANINGGGFATVLDRDAWDFVSVTSLEIKVDVGAACTLQQWGE